MGFFGKIFGGVEKLAKTEETKPAELSEEEEKKWFEKGEKIGQETGKKVDTEKKEEEWFKQGEDKKE